MRVAIVGLGKAGGVHLDAWRLVPGVEVAAVCDPSPSARGGAADVGLRGYAELEEMLQCEQLDAVTIATPPADHADVAMACFRAGLHVLCEKPLALHTPEALSILQAAARKRRHLLLATKFRHVAEVVRAREIIHAGEIGEPLAFEVSFCAPVDMSRRWNAQPERSGGGVLIDNGCHAIDLVAFLFGAVNRVHATALKPLQRLAVEDSVTLQMEAGAGVIGRADVSWSLSIGRDSYLVVYGSRGTVELGWNVSRFKRAGQSWQEFGGSYDKLAAHRHMAACFAEVVASGEQRWISALECLQTVAAVDAGYRSMQSGGWERMEVERIGRRHAMSL